MDTFATVICGIIIALVLCGGDFLSGTGGRPHQCNVRQHLLAAAVDCAHRAAGAFGGGADVHTQTLQKVVYRYSVRAYNTLSKGIAV